MEEIDIKELLNVLLKKLYIVIIVTIIGAIAGFIYSRYMIDPLYKSTTSFVLSQVTSTKNDVQISEITQNDVTLNQKLVSTYSEIIKSKTIAKQVISKLDLAMSEEEFMSRITVNAKDDTELILISVSNEDPILASDIANCLVEVFREKISEVYKIENLSVIDIAEPSIYPYNIGTFKNTCLFGMIGLVLSCGIIFIIYYFDNTIKKQEDIEELLGVPVIASIALYNEELEAENVYGN
ncbi:MAG: Wzz/FepE/Etk N-terminal domain-containing protein [Clostridia bacterium]|nr:Wzz/FepE/Etk N-terminal domain-containing protein [Clostridia bacterium]